jgi:hypothetical protein
MAKEYIEREAVLVEIKRKYGKDLGWQCTVNMSDVANIIKDAPTADVVEVVHGKWMFNRHQAPNEKSYYCSLCAEGESDYGRDNYCPNCGAKMDGKGDENQ